ncbi:hypothetical protein BH20ACI1_BH20ACI1_24330 [soil metagenome]
MKKLILIFVVFQLASFSLLAQTSADEVEKLKQFNQQVIAKYKEGDFNDALKAAQQALDLTIKIFGAESSETATSYTNLGEIYLAKKKYDEAIENLQKSLTIYQQKPKPNADKIAKNMERLGIAFTLDGKEKQGAEVLSKSVTTAENVFGQDSREILPYLRTLSDFYIYAKKPDEAQQIITRRYLISSKYFEPDSAELQKIEDDFTCFAYQNFKWDEVSERQNTFNEEIGKEKKDVSENKTIINGGIINGKAKSLITPAYPASARARKARGVIPVRVTVDEQGKVIEAKAVCGDSDLGAASVEAARKSKFTPTTIEGKAVKVTGIIVYNFTF